MTPEKRDEEMEFICGLTMTDKQHKALSECWRKAKAWDEARTWADNCIGTWSPAGIKDRLNKILPPEPTTPLGKLEAWIKDENSRLFSTKPCLRPEDILAKIAELRKEEGKP